MSDVPNVIPEAIPSDVEKGVVERKIQVQPQDEVYADPNNPGFADPRQFPTIRPEDLKISVRLNMQPILDKVNKAVLTGEIDEIVSLWNKARFMATKESNTLVDVKCDIS